MFLQTYFYWCGAVLNGMMAITLMVAIVVSFKMHIEDRKGRVTNYGYGNKRWYSGAVANGSDSAAERTDIDDCRGNGESEIESGTH